MNRRIKIFSLLILFFTIVLFSNISYCADGSLKASQSTSGEKITVTVTSSKALGAFTLKTSGATAIDGSSDVGAYGNNTISGASASGATTLGKFIFAVPENDTKVTFSVSQLATDVDDNDLEINNTSITLKGKKVETKTPDKGTTSNKDNTTTTNKDTNTTPTQPKEKSNNAYLKTLGVRIADSLASELGVKTDEYDFSGFSKTKTSYNVTVPKNVDSLKIVATPADSNAKVSVSGNSGFEVGSNNKITIKVTAEDGKTTQTYTIKVTRLAEEEEKPGNLIEDEEGIYLTSLSIEGVELSPAFAKDTYSYTARLIDSSLNEVEVKAEANNENVKIDISGNTELMEGENTINILLTLEDSTVQTVYQIVVTKEALEVATTDTSENNPTSTTDLIGTIKNYALIAIVVIVLIIIAVIVLIIMLRRENKKIYDEDEDDELEEYNVYKNDENEFRNNDIEKDNFIESLYRQRTGNIDEEDLNKDEKETLEEISKQTEEILANKIEGQSVEFDSKEIYDENPLEVRKRRRGKGKHSI